MKECIVWTRDELQFVSRIGNRYLFPYRTANAEGTVLFVKQIINTKIFEDINKLPVSSAYLICEPFRAGIFFFNFSTSCI